ncbi:MAG TPA: stress response translation initiation inhibitor YciH [bacterium]|nr:stress response translation initiation inhibitor YciH [bacterium]HNT65018.1 stress response translation initiation inhibitor YciH [bacterium]HOX84425.1 stress response translation initiation inhibitor YciH [bacterium]HPG45978.1 stress response translation initiation inhibitor YciH [bacterium]HPM97800.1 stress response translation initiation inhibitor YciH [bacterium]
MKIKLDRSTRVYSTALGNLCPNCGQPADGCLCEKQTVSPVARGDGVVRLSLETKGRKGKGVTIISGLSPDVQELQQMARRLKQKLGSGGTVKDSRIEIQGDHRQWLLRELREQGYTVKLAGG